MVISHINSRNQSVSDDSARFIKLSLHKALAGP